MLSSLHILNFKCLRDVKLAFGPFTVLIGPNDSGKSSILDALRILGSTAVARFADVFRGDDALQHLGWKPRSRDQAITWDVTWSRKHVDWQYQLVLDSGGSSEVVRDVNGSPDAQARAANSKYTEVLRSLTPGAYDPDATGLAAHQQQLFHGLAATGHLHTLANAPRFRLNPDLLRRPAVPTPDAVLSATGDNLAAVLDRLISGPDRSAITRLESALQDAIPTLKGIALRTIDGKTGAKALEFVLRSEGKGPPLTIPCAHASDGAMLLTAFLALAFSDDPGLLLIEEPENGLHPSRLQSVVEMLRKISEGALGNQPRQVIVTTHSPLLLNYTRPEEVRIIRRDLERGTLVTPMIEVPDVQQLLGEFGVGELWYLLGEQALVEGKKP